MSVAEDLRSLGIHLVDGRDLLARLAIARRAHGIDKEVRVLVMDAIVQWLGSAFDLDGHYAGNPDYYNADDVHELATAIIAALDHAPAP